MQILNTTSCKFTTILISPLILLTQAQAIVIEDFNTTLTTKLEVAETKSTSFFVPTTSISEGISFGRKLKLKGFSVNGYGTLVLSSPDTENVTLDVNKDGRIDESDTVKLKAHLAYLNSRMNSNEQDKPDLKFDVNGDGHVSPLDLLPIKNYISSHPTLENQGQSSRRNTPSNLTYTASKGHSGTASLILDYDKDPKKIKYDGLGINLNARNGKGFIIHASNKSSGGKQPEIWIDIFTTDENRSTRCIIPLRKDSENLTYGIRFEHCKKQGSEGPADLRFVGALVLTINGNGVTDANVSVSNWSTDSLAFGNTEGSDDLIIVGSSFTSKD